MSSNIKWCPYSNGCEKDKVCMEEWKNLIIKSAVQVLRCWPGWEACGASRMPPAEPAFRLSSASDSSALWSSDLLESWFLVGPVEQR